MGWAVGSGSVLFVKKNLQIKGRLEVWFPQKKKLEKAYRKERKMNGGF